MPTIDEIAAIEEQIQNHSIACDCSLCELVDSLALQDCNCEDCTEQRS